MSSTIEFFHPEMVPDEQSSVRSFADTIDRLLIPHPLEGSLLIIGHGPACPERALFTNTPHFEELASGVEQVLFCDPDLYTNPWLFFKQHVYTPIEKKPDNVMLQYFPASLQEIESELPQALDTTTFFRQSQRLATYWDVAQIVFAHTKPSGVYMGSGNFDSKQQAIDLLSDVGWHVAQCTALPDPDYSGFAYFNHIGFVAIKD